MTLLLFAHDSALAAAAHVHLPLGTLRTQFGISLHNAARKTSKNER